MADPVSEHHGQAVLGVIVEFDGRGLGVDAPDADGVAAEFDEGFAIAIAADALDEVGLVIAEELPLAVISFDEFDRMDFVEEGDGGGHILA